MITHPSLTSLSTDFSRDDLFLVVFCLVDDWMKVRFGSSNAPRKRRGPRDDEFSDAEVSIADSAYAAARGADALLILTDWEEFSALDLSRLRAALRQPIIVDGRNLYQPEVMAAHGFRYISIGRPEANPMPETHLLAWQKTRAS